MENHKSSQLQQEKEDEQHHHQEKEDTQHHQKSSQLQQEKEDEQHHHQEEEDTQHHQKHQEEEEDKHLHLEQLSEEEEQEKHPHLEELNHLPEERRQQHQEPQVQHLEDQRQPQKQEEDEEEEPENKLNHKVPQFPLSKRSTPPTTIPKAQPPPSDHSPVGSTYSSDNSSLSHGFSPPQQTSLPCDTTSKPPVVMVSRLEFTTRDQATINTVEVVEQTEKVGSASSKRLRPDLSILRRTKRDKMMKKTLLGFRISGFAFCLVSFSVLAADRDQGWALDSFYRYKEFRFCMAVNVIGFAYSGLQAYDLIYQLTAGRRKLRTRLRYYIDFVLDQILAYLLISASSSAAVRVDDWQANWGKDKFPEMARASMALSVVAFVSLALSSLISGYTLCTFNSA